MPTTTHTIDYGTTTTAAPTPADKFTFSQDQNRVTCSSDTMIAGRGDGERWSAFWEVGWCLDIETTRFANLRMADVTRTKLDRNLPEYLECIREVCARPRQKGDRHAMMH